MGIPTYDFSVKQGNSGTLDNPAGLVVVLRTNDGQPRDLTGTELVFCAHWERQPRIRMTSGDGAITLEESAGRITVPFPVATFRDVSSRKMVRYELELRQGGEQRTILKGRITVEEGFNDD